MVWVHGEEDRLMASIVDAPSRPVAPKHYWTIERSRDFRKRNGSKTRCFSSFSDHFGGVHRDVEKGTIVSKVLMVHNKPFFKL